MGIQLVTGRPFDETDSATSQPVIGISQATARAIWGNDDPIGSQVRIGGESTGPWRTVIGVVSDVHHDDLTQPLVPAMYTPQTQMTDSVPDGHREVVHERCGRSRTPGARRSARPQSNDSGLWRCDGVDADRAIGRSGASSSRAC